MSWYNKTNAHPRKIHLSRLDNLFLNWQMRKTNIPSTIAPPSCPAYLGGLLVTTPNSDKTRQEKRFQTRCRRWGTRRVSLVAHAKAKVLKVSAAVSEAGRVPGSLQKTVLLLSKETAGSSRITLGSEYTVINEIVGTSIR